MALDKAKVITVTSVKGGTGKSTTVLNLAGVYCMQQKKTLIIDLDLYASAICPMLNITSNDDLYRLFDDINNNRYEHFEDYVIKYNEFIDVIQAPKDPRYSSKINSRFLSIIFTRAALKYDIVLIDTNHFLNEINLTAFDYSDKLLYVITNDAIDLKNMKTMNSIFKDMGTTNYKILLNMSLTKGRKKYSKNDIKTFVKHDVDYVIKDNFYIKDIDDYVEKGTILTLDKKIRLWNNKAITNYTFIANDLLKKEVTKEG